MKTKLLNPQKFPTPPTSQEHPLGFLKGHGGDGALHDNLGKQMKTKFLNPHWVIFTLSMQSSTACNIKKNHGWKVHVRSHTKYVLTMANSASRR